MKKTTIFIKSKGKVTGKRKKKPMISSVVGLIIGMRFLSKGSAQSPLMNNCLLGIGIAIFARVLCNDVEWLDNLITYTGQLIMVLPMPLLEKFQLKVTFSFFVGLLFCVSVANLSASTVSVLSFCLHKS